MGEFILQHHPPGPETLDTKAVVEAEVLWCGGTESGSLDLRMGWAWDKRSWYPGKEKMNAREGHTFLSEFPALMSHLEANASVCVETEK